MHIAIDDTYGPETRTDSRYVTGTRRTHIAIVFPHTDVDYYRSQIMTCLEEVNRSLGVKIGEFHFAHIFNRKPPWDALPEGVNLRLFESFAHIYSLYRWKVFVQTVDDRTLADHAIQLKGKVEGIDLSERADLSLFLLLLKIKLEYKSKPEPITLLIDEGKRKPGTMIGNRIFYDWPEKVEGRYVSSGCEPLLQLADFLAYCINRSTYLATKRKRSASDNWFLNLVGGMEINSRDVSAVALPDDFTVEDFDRFHDLDRKGKGLPSL
jgi:hypothetical protein